MINLETALSNLNENFSDITNLIPNSYKFTDERAGFDTPNVLGDVVFAQSDGKIIWGGKTSYGGFNFNGAYKYNLVRFNTDGTIDDTFVDQYFLGNNDGYIRSVAQQSDGKLIVVGHFTGVGIANFTYNRIVRLNTNGTIDITFADGLTGFDDNALVVKVLSDNSILVGGKFSYYNGTLVNKLVRLDSSGNLDTAFNSNISGYIGGNVNAITVDGSGNIYVGGEFSNYIIKLGSDGTPDATFVVGSGFNDRVSAIAIDNGGKIIVGGWFSSYDGSACRKIVRLNTDGTIDNTFNDSNDFNDPNGSIQSIAIQSDQKILVSGWFTAYGSSEQRFIARLNTDGTLDTSFDVALKFSMTCSNSGNGYQRRVQSIIFVSGTIFMAHSLFTYNGQIQPYFTAIDTNGDLVSGFELPPIHDVRFDWNEDPPLGHKLEVFGTEIPIVFWAGEGARADTTSNFMAFNPDGIKVDGFFQENMFDGQIRNFFIDPPVVYVCGDFNNVNDLPFRYLARLGPTGYVDTTFLSGTKANDGIWSVKVLSNGKILIGGRFTSYDGNSTNRICLLTNNGEFDTACTEAALDNMVFTTAVDADGKIYVGGRFTGGILRLNSDLTLDTGFDVGSGFGSPIGNNPRVSSIEIDGDGKVVVGHWFTEYNGSPCSPGITRLNTDGSIDNTFATEGTGLESSVDKGIVQTVKIQTDGKILVGGWFDTYNGNPQRKIIRLNSNGTKDTSFTAYGVGGDFGDNNGPRVNSIDLDADGNIYCAGNIVTFNEIPRYPVVKISSTGDIATDFSSDPGVFVAGIGDGGNDMYDSANCMYTNLRQSFADAQQSNPRKTLAIPVTHTPMMFGAGEGGGGDFEDNQYVPLPDGRIMDGSLYFGPESSYFTNMYTGMFVMCATNVTSDVTDFFIAGNLGADGNGDEASFNVNVYGNLYTIFVKKVYGTSDPSINHIIIVPGNGSGITHDVDTTTEYDDDSVSGLNVNELFYLVVASASGGLISNTQIQTIATKFLEVIGAGYEDYQIQLTKPNRAVEGDEGNLDFVLVNGKSIQRDGYIQTNQNLLQLIKLKKIKDGDMFSNQLETLSDFPWIETF